MKIFTRCPLTRDGEHSHKISRIGKISWIIWGSPGPPGGGGGGNRGNIDTNYIFYSG